MARSAAKGPWENSVPGFFFCLRKLLSPFEQFSLCSLFAQIDVEAVRVCMLGFFLIRGITVGTSRAAALV